MTRGGSLQLLAQEEAQQLDVELMQTPGFSIDQLMELAGGCTHASELRIV